MALRSPDDRGFSRTSGIIGRTLLDPSDAYDRARIQSRPHPARRRLAALRILEAEALPGLDENEALSARSYEVGQIGLPDLLLIRREMLDTRTAYLDTLLEAALARVDLDASAGVTP